MLDLTLVTKTAGRYVIKINYQSLAVNRSFYIGQEPKSPDKILAKGKSTMRIGIKLLIFATILYIPQASSCASMSEFDKHLTNAILQRQF